MSGLLPALFAAHIEWRGLRKSLTGQAQRKFERWVGHAHPEIAAQFKGQSALFFQMCNEVRRGVLLPRPRGIGQKTIEKHAEALVRRHLAGATEETFSGFLERLVKKYPSERALKRFLASGS